MKKRVQPSDQIHTGVGSSQKKSSSGRAKVPSPRQKKGPQEIVRDQGHQHKREEEIEELRKKQKELKASRDRYFDLYDLAPIGFFTFDQNGLITEVNHAGARLLDADPQRLINKPFSNFINKNDQEIFRDYLRTTLKRERPLIIEISLSRKDASPVIVQLQSIGVEDNGGSSTHCSTAAIDITLRKQAESDLRGAYTEMDQRVKERTQDLFTANQRLVQEIENRKKAEESLQDALSEVRQLRNKLREENLYLKEECNLLQSHNDIVGNSELIRAVLNQIEQVSSTDATVLIQGETGTGKELIANAIHGMSPRKDRLMIKVNCGALPPTLIESELFGREKGAFTGALSKQIGRFELADASTIFLDEIDALPLELQAKLLRVLESGEFERLGNPRTVKVNVRIIAATNRDLARVVSEGGFREDLYYRLNVFQIVVPPLRERREDILPLVWSFVQDFSKRMGKRIESIPQKEVEVLQAYSWPGNVRELRNVTERAMIITTGPVLHLNVPRIVRSGVKESGTLADVERQHIIETLNTTQWRVSGRDGAADILGMNPKTLESKMQKLGIQRIKNNS